MNLRDSLRELTPPVILRIVRAARPTGLRFEGDYGTWTEARQASRGYDASEILQRVHAAELKVRRGEAADARDGVAFSEIQFSFPVMMALARAAARKGQLHVIDFGGALGGLYRQYKALQIPGVLSWTVVEQKPFVDLGHAEFANSELRFAETLEEAALGGGQPDVVLLSSVLQYLPDPYALIPLILECGAKHIVVDRTPCSALLRDVLTIQKIPPEIYDASYPCWIFSRARMVEALSKGFSTFASFADGSGVWHADATDFQLTGFIFDARRTA